MTFISYAQNLEDVMLWRALGGYSPGFYIDIGAHDPLIDSITKAFSERGWSGINVEPIRTLFEKINLDRPRDLNLNVAIDTENGEKIFYDIGHSNGLSTLVKTYADKHAAVGFEVKESIVKTVPFSDICTQFIKKDQDIHFLKIDTEGNEKSVLANADFKNYRPWIILVEATEPMTTTPSFSDWEPILLAANYTFVYFDGLNRFYIANEKFETLHHHFFSPPNVFDNYVPYQSDMPLINIQKQLASAEIQLADTKTQLTALLTSRSWRWTKLLRTLLSHKYIKAIKNKILIVC